MRTFHRFVDNTGKYILFRPEEFLHGDTYLIPTKWETIAVEYSFKKLKNRKAYITPFHYSYEIVIKSTQLVTILKAVFSEEELYALSDPIVLDREISLYTKVLDYLDMKL